MKKRIMVAMGLMAALLVVAAGVAWAATVNCKVGEPCVGTNDPDRLNGTNQEDDMFARQDDDLLRGRSGFDILFGDHPPVQNTTTDGDDELFGNNGPDTLAGLGGSDVLKGAGQADHINAIEASENPGEDTVGGAAAKTSSSRKIMNLTPSTAATTWTRSPSTRGSTVWQPTARTGNPAP